MYKYLTLLALKYFLTVMHVLTNNLVIIPKYSVSDLDKIYYFTQVQMIFVLIFCMFLHYVNINTPYKDAMQVRNVRPLASRLKVHSHIIHDRPKDHNN